MQNISVMDLSMVAGGALQEIAEREIEKVVENLNDENTPWKPKRMVTIKLEFTQNENRDDVTMKITADTPKLAPAKPVETKFSMGKDLRSGQIYMEEYGPQIKGQMSLGDYMPPADPAPEVSRVTDFRVKEA